MNKRAKKEREEQLKATKKCSVTLKRIPANLLAQHGTYVEVNTSNGALLPINQTSERARRLESRLARVAYGKRGPPKFNKKVNNGSNSSHQSVRSLRVVGNKENERCETHVKAKACDGIHVAEHQPAKRARRIKSCLDGVVPENRGQQSDNNLNKDSKSPHQFGRTSRVVENKENERNKTHDKSNVLEGILVSVDPPAKRTLRFKSGIDRFVLENRDEFQERDQNPVMQPVKNGPNPKLKMNTNIVAKNEEYAPTAKPTAMRRHSIVPELIPLVETSENQKAKCSKCFNYEQIIAQL